MTGPGEPLRPPSPADLADDLPALPGDLARVDRTLRESVRTTDPFLADVAAHLIGAGGKRLRPTLTLCAAYASGTGSAGPATDDAVTGGVACELVHLGSLYHDDVIDEASTRRGVETVNAKWGNLQAILAGDFLLARASEIAASLGAEVAGLLGNTIARLCEGEIEQLTHTYDVHRTEPRMLARVTAHVHDLVGRVNERESRALDGLGVACEREHRTVVIRITRPVQKAHAGGHRDDLREPVDDVETAPLADVRYALDDA